MVGATGVVFKRFQFPPPCRGRHGIPDELPANEEVSIPAPVQGATSELCSHVPIYGSFNSRPRAGGDICRKSPLLIVLGFNSRPRAGGDGTLVDDGYNIQLFQFPPPCRGRRCAQLPPLCRQKVSIPAPVQGATETRFASAAQSLFQFPPPCRGRRPLQRQNTSRHNVSIPAPRAGGDPAYRRRKHNIQEVSIPAPVQGATVSGSLQSRSYEVSIPAPVQGATILRG